MSFSRLFVKDTARSSWKSAHWLPTHDAERTFMSPLCFKATLTVTPIRAV